jgi:DNA repair ATPase RecN
MGTRKSPSAPQWQVILEEIRSQNRSTMEALEAFRQSLEERIDRLDRESRGRDELLALAVTGLQREVRQHSTDLTDLRRLSLRHGADIVELKGLAERHGQDIDELKGLGQQHSTDIRELKLTVQESTVELRSLSHKVDALNRLEERVAALERRTAEPDGSSTPPPA